MLQHFVEFHIFNFVFFILSYFYMYICSLSIIRFLNLSLLLPTALSQSQSFLCVSRQLSQSFRNFFPASVWLCDTVLRAGLTSRAKVGVTWRRSVSSDPKDWLSQSKYINYQVCYDRLRSHHVTVTRVTRGVGSLSPSVVAARPI